MFALAPLLLATTALPAQLEGNAPPGGLETPWLHYPNNAGQAPGKGRRVVLIAGDEEYRSEEVQPMLARQLHALGFECYVLFSQNPETGEVDPNQLHHIPGTELIANADLLVIQLRFRELPEAQMKPIVDYIEAGKPVIGIRTSTHAFHYKKNRKDRYAHWDFRAQDWKDGFGRQILGETWISHHGNHGSQATRALPHPMQAHHPALRGVGPAFGPSDVYGVRELPGDATVLLEGQVVSGMSPDDPALEGKKNSPMMPVAWVREILRDDGRPSQRVFTTTMGTADDWTDVDLRRLLLNASLWCLGEADVIPREGFPATLTENWHPTPFGFNGARTGYRPEDYRQGSPWAKRVTAGSATRE
ncbi:MAG: ThuA domain-containing protein [Planctomycetes bacterium]|nr:ThuA domain-containing protein [Planctomycetota bacterium]